MSKWSNLLLDINYMKLHSKDISRLNTIYISKQGEIDINRLKDAAIARYYLDRLLLNNSDLEKKWAQVMIYSFLSDSIVFVGDERECFDWLKKNDTEFVCKIIYTLPEETYYNWDKYIDDVRKRCKLKIT